MRTRVLVADSRDIFRSGVGSLLRSDGRFEVAEAADLSELLASASRHAPDLALLDADLPPAGGVVAVRALRALCRCHVVVWSFEPSRETILEAMFAGASGYLEKTLEPRALVRALGGALAGEAALPRHLAARMIEALHATEDRIRARERTAVLSSREREVLGLVASGAANREIADRLLISEFTVKRHVQNILRKLRVSSRAEAGSYWGLAVAGDAGVEAL